LPIIMERLRTLISLNSRKILLIVITGLVAYLVVPPIATVIFSSFRSTESRLPFEVSSYTLVNYIQVFTSDVTFRLLLNTAWYAVGSVVIAIGIAVLFAWLLERTDIPLRRVMFIMVLAPIGMPEIIGSMAWILLANPTNGLLNIWLRMLLGLDSPGPINIYSIPGMIVISALGFIPMIYIMISGVFSRIDPSFEEAARTSGAGRWSTVRRISIPLLGPAILAAVIYYFVRAIEVFEIPAMLGMPKGIFVFSTAIYYAVHPVTGFPDYGFASTYGMILLVTAGILIYVYGRYTRQVERFATVTGRGFRPRLIQLGKLKWVPVVLISFYFIFVVLMPLLILLWTSLTPRFTPFSFSSFSLFNLNAYRRLLELPYLVAAAKNTLIIAVCTATIGMLLVTLASWLSTRGKMRGSWIPERLGFMVIGVPGIVIGMALIFIYASMPLPLYGTIWVIILGLVTTSLPFGTRLMGSAFLQIHRELEEAAAISGASLFTTFFKVVLPLLWPSFLRGFLQMFIRAMRETTIALILYSAGNQTLAVTLWNLWVEDAQFQLASAIAVPLMLLTIILTYFVANKTMLREKGT